MKESSVIKPTAAPQSGLLSNFTVENLSLWGLYTTILLIAVGSFVRVTGHGLGCPDWPLCYGRAIPPLDVGAWVEFSHRFVAGIVSLQVAGLMVLAWRHHRAEKWIFYPTVAAVGVIIAQIWLGATHVLNELPAWTGVVHTATAMIIAGLLALLVAVTRPSLQKLGRETAVALQKSRLMLWTAVAAISTYILILTGSLVTRTGASLACPSFPHCGLSVVPDYLQHLITLQMIHRYTAFAVTAAIILVLYYLLRNGRSQAGLRPFAWGLISLLVIQIGLGMSNVLLSLPLWSRILHLTTAGAIWALMVILTVMLYRGRTAVSG
jgi:heme A synthase